MSDCLQKLAESTTQVAGTRPARLPLVEALYIDALHPSWKRLWPASKSAPLQMNQPTISFQIKTAVNWGCRWRMKQHQGGWREELTWGSFLESGSTQLGFQSKWKGTYSNHVDPTNVQNQTTTITGKIFPTTKFPKTVGIDKVQMRGPPRTCGCPFSTTCCYFEPLSRPPRLLVFIWW